MLRDGGPRIIGACLIRRQAALFGHYSCLCYTVLQHMKRVGLTVRQQCETLER